MSDTHNRHDTWSGSGSGTETEPPRDTPPSAEEIAQSLLFQAKELWEYFLFYLSVRSDQTRLRINQLIANAVLGAIGAIVCMGLLICAAWFVLLGMAGGFSELFHSAWLGHLTAGLLMLTVIALGVFLVFRKQRGDFLKRTKLKYEQQRVEQHAKFGRDVGSKI